jgi:FtsZ-binding cell division protein ZapB
LDRETVLQQFSQLEKKIEDLVEYGKLLESENDDLKQQNQRVSQQLQEKIAIEQENDDLKGLIRSRIDNLMGKLNGIAGD